MQQSAKFVPNVIGLQGIRGSGKDTAFEILQENRPFQRLAFADLLYNEVSEAFGISVADLGNRLTKETPQARLALSQCSNHHFREVFLRLHPTDNLNSPQSPRKILQYWGSEFRREQYSPTYWTDPILQTLLQNPSKNYAVTDTRFPNEAALLTGVPLSMLHKFSNTVPLPQGLPNAIIARIRRPDIEEAYLALPKEEQHSSEISLLDWPVFVTWINEKNKQAEFKAQIRDFVQQYFP